MTKDEIKKALYKQKPLADMLMVYKNEAIYETSLEDGTVLFFEVPVNDMGETRFLSKMEAHLLIRWLNVK